ncbi:MAG: hypothetical protein JJT89_14000 [Nitriliruptoraceae bacterium]|nr:hypothetical protein [Nitriliruptoraceae bacterium]
MERHRLRPSYLVAGVVFTAVGVVGVLGGAGLSAGDLRWLGPALLVLLGIALVIGTAARRPDAEAADGDPEAADPEAAGTRTAAVDTRTSQDDRVTTPAEAASAAEADDESGGPSADRGR